MRQPQTFFYIYVKLKTTTTSTPFPHPKKRQTPNNNPKPIASSSKLLTMVGCLELKGTHGDAQSWHSLLSVWDQTIIAAFYATFARLYINNIKILTNQVLIC